MKVAIKILSVFLCGIGVVMFLQLYARYKEGAPSGFDRRIIPGVLSEAKHYPIGSASTYIISLDSIGMKLGVANQSGLVLSIPYSLSKADSFMVQLPDSIHFAWAAAKIIASGNRIFLQEGITPNIFEVAGNATMPCGGIADFPPFDLIAFYDSGFACRNIDTVSQKYTIQIKPDNRSAIYTKGLLTAQQDGFFSNDGMLLFDRTSHRFVYVYYYRNKLEGFSPSFDTVYFGKTIDTISWAHITTHSIKSERKVAFSSPPLKVNKHACTWDGLLFVYSALRADNEKGKLAFSSSAIDVYNTRDFKYLGSFYLPNYDGEGIRDFAVNNGRLVALRGDGIFVFKLDLGAIAPGR